MELEVMKELIKKHKEGHADFVSNAIKSEQYYKNETDVLIYKKKKDEEGNPIRNADNRIPRNFHGLIVNQKASYAFTAPPLFDVGTTKSNTRIVEVLGDEYGKNCMELCVNAANTSIGWVHYWESKNGFEWAVVDSKQIIPVWSKKLKKELLGVLRIYTEIDETTGEIYCIYEYWTDRKCQSFRAKGNDMVCENLEIYNMFFDPLTNNETVIQMDLFIGLKQIGLIKLLKKIFYIYILLWMII